MHTQPFGLMGLFCILLEISCRCDWRKRETEISSKCDQLQSNLQPYPAAQTATIQLAHLSAPQLPKTPGNLPLVTSNPSMHVNPFSFVSLLHRRLSKQAPFLCFPAVCVKE